VPNNRDAFKIGNFGFFKDPGMKLRLSEDNLFDQMNSDGTVDVWLGGQDIWLPDYGTFNIHVTCDQTFFWDIIDENGNRTKTGFTAIQIPFNPNFKPAVGDLLPLNHDEVFDYTFESPSDGDNPLICSNLWFYNNFFMDEYYRYNLILIHQSEGNTWPNEIGARTTPMNDNLTIHDGEFIMGYRPKPEYMNQLAVLNKLISGPENKILFRLTVDLEYLANNPSAKRILKVFSQTDDVIRYTVYPRSVDDIIWRHKGRRFLNEYQRYLLDNGVTQYLPRDPELDWADRVYDEAMKASNRILNADTGYRDEIAQDMERYMDDPTVVLSGYSALVREHYLEWLKESTASDIVTELYPILRRVLYSRMYFKGFLTLSNLMGYGIEKPGTPELPGLTPAPVGPTVNIITVDGVKKYSNGYVPLSAKEYLNPKSGYAYDGDTGSGFYSILIAQQEVSVFCDMTTDGGGWMVLIAGPNVDIDYLSIFGDTYFIKNVMYTDQTKGIGWTPESGETLAFQMYNVPFNEVHALVSGEFDNPEGSSGELTFVTSSAGQILSVENDGSRQEVITQADGIILTDVIEDIENMNYESLHGTGDMNSLTIKMKNLIGGRYSRRFISFLRIR